MNIFKNKYFLLGNLAFLLLVIPVVLFIIKNQTSTNSSAAPTTTLSFIGPNLETDQCTEKTARLVLNPDQNIVSTVELGLKWDKTKFDVEFTPNSTAFQQILDGPTYTNNGSMTIILNTGQDVTKAIHTTTDIGTVTIKKPMSPTVVGTNALLEIDTTITKVYSLSENDGEVEDVFNAGGSSPLSVAILAKACDGTTTTTDEVPTATTAPVAVAPTATTAPVAVATPTTAANASPICDTLSSSTSSGSAPLSVTLTATGHDTNGTIAKVSINFGDGSSQEVSTGLGSASGSAQIAHTYNSGGTFTATSSFTDNGGASSPTCTSQIVVTGAFATMAPVATATLAPIATEVPTATPTIAASGNLGTTLSIIGGILFVVIAGFFLLVL